MKRSLLRIAFMAVLVSVPVAAWACGEGGDDDDDGGGSEATVRVVAENTRFSPRAITVASGREVTLELENRDAFEHDLEVDGLAVEVIGGGPEPPAHGGEHGSEAGVLAVHTDGEESASITFVANELGTYEFFCTIPGHKDSGMVGTLTVQ